MAPSSWRRRCRYRRRDAVPWLEPYPDSLLDGLADAGAGPEARHDAREAISLAFVTALQLLPPQQRAALVLRDVLAFSAREAAGMLATSEEAVTSALKRARATLRRELPSRDRPLPTAEVERDLLDRLVTAFEAADVDGIVALMSDDAWLRMPPQPLEYQGPELIRRFFATVAFRPGRQYRMAPARANGQPALAAYLRDPAGGAERAAGLLVVTLDGDRIGAITRFENRVLERMWLPLRRSAGSR